jgi:hypothetical protein
MFSRQADALRIEVQHVRDALQTSEAQHEALKRRDLQIQADRDEWETSHDRLRREIQELKRALEEVRTLDGYAVSLAIIALNRVPVYYLTMYM